jgi:DNA-binding MarR family transcriptional regulator
VDDHGEDLDLVHLLRRLTVEFDLLGAAFAAANGLHPTDLRALIHLLDAARADLDASPRWLGEQLNMNSAGTTALIDRLERLGHVRRIRDKPDRRRVRLVVDERAIALGWAFFGPLIADMVAAMGDFDGAELATVRRFLLRMHGVVVARRDG